MPGHEARRRLLNPQHCYCLQSKIDGYVSRKSRAIYLAQLKTVSAWVSITGAKMGCRDPDDDMLLETALLGDADCLVTGDRELLEMTPFRGIPILTPTIFFARDWLS